jgi:hypothetical protein
MGTPQLMKTVVVRHLRCHKAIPCDDVRAVRVIVRRSSDELEMGYRLDGNLSRIRLASQSKPDSPDELWLHTCFEAFVAIDGQADYYEFNFAPSSAWGVHAFHSYRDPAPLAKILHRAAVVVSNMDQRLELDARIVLSELSALYSHAPLRLGLSAVIESWNGSLSYWALHHPGGKPDFHHAEAFALRLQPPESG